MFCLHKSKVMKWLKSSIRMAGAVSRTSCVRTMIGLHKKNWSFRWLLRTTRLLEADMGSCWCSAVGRHHPCHSKYSMQPKYLLHSQNHDLGLDSDPCWGELRHCYSPANQSQAHHRSLSIQLSIGLSVQKNIGTNQHVVNQIQQI